MPIATKPGLPAHPHIAYLNSLPEYPGMVLKTWRSFTKAQAEKVFPGHELPGKGNKLVLQFPAEPLPLVDVVKLPRAAKGEPAMWAARYFARAVNLSTPQPVNP